MQDLQHSYPVAKVAKNVNGTTFGEGVSLKVHNGIKSILKAQNIIFSYYRGGIMNKSLVAWWLSRPLDMKLIVAIL